MLSVLFSPDKVVRILGSAVLYLLMAGEFSQKLELLAEDEGKLALLVCIARTHSWKN